MSESSLKKELLLGSLMAFVITGNAFAADDSYIGSYTLGSSHTDAQILSSANFSVGPSDDVLTINKYKVDGYSARFKDMTDVKLKAKTISSFGIFARDDTKLDIGSSDTDSVAINGDTVTGVVALARSQVTINAKNISISTNATADEAAIWVQNNTQSEPAPAGASSVKLVGDKIVITSKGLGIVNFSNGQFNAEGDITIDAPIALDVRGNSTTKINTEGNHTTVINGDIQFETPWKPGEGHNSGNLVNAHVDLNLTGKDSSWTGSSYIIAGDDDNPIYDGNGGDNYGPVIDFKLNMQDGATWNATGNSYVNDVTVGENSAVNVKEDTKLANLQKVNLAGGNINLEGSGQQINVVDELSGEGQITTNSLDNQVTIGEDKTSNLTVNGTKEVTDAIASGNANLQDLANVVKSGEKSAADSVTTDANDIIGGYSAKLDGDGNVQANTVKTLENTTNRAISDMANISLMTWRQENNDMNKRLGELRDSKGEHGAWARMARGESKYGSQNVKNQYNYYQVGYDEKLSTNPNWTVGVALTRTEGTSTFARGTGENKHTGFAVYGSYLNDNGSFVDLIAKYARMDNDYSTIGAGVGDASYETNGYSLSAEYGKRFTKDNGFWIEPQVELTYGTVGSVDYLTSKGARVHQDSVDSLVCRLGFSLGKDIKQGNVYVRASYLYDFDGETKATMSGVGTASFEQDLGGGWWEVGVGTNLNLSDATHLYFDVEKTYGGNVATPWQWNAGVRWSF